MYDRDIQLLQFCAANLPPDQFLLHLLNKFNLLNWASSGFEVSEEESIRHVTVLVEEFLGLAVTLAQERHSPGIGRGGVEDMVRQEVVQLLCVEPMSHSALNKALPEDVNHETGLERVIDQVPFIFILFIVFILFILFILFIFFLFILIITALLITIDQVATFKKPVGGASAKGVYELKEENYGEYKVFLTRSDLFLPGEYNVFFYHFTREDQSKSEESQRARLKAAGKAQVLGDGDFSSFTNPIPPRYLLPLRPPGCPSVSPASPPCSTAPSCYTS